MSEQERGHPEQRQTCPSRLNELGPWSREPNQDWWRSDETCSFCGSLHPETFMRRLEAGDVEIVPTDKSYKAYLRNTGGAEFHLTYRDCPPKSSCQGPDDCTHWTTNPISEVKFYYAHLSVEQRRRWVELLNDGQLKIAYPGHFYVLPFFVEAIPRAAD